MIAVSPVDVVLPEWTTRCPESEAGLAGASLGSPVQREIAESLTEKGMLHVLELRTGLSVRSTSYVGRITLGDLTVSVEPKLAGDHLLSLFRYAYGLRDLRLIGASSFAAGGGAFQDLLIAQLLTETTEIHSRGLHRQYRRMAGELANPRGRLDLQGIARQGGVVSARLPCTFHPRSEDCLHNRALLSGLDHAARLAGDPQLRVDCRKTVALFADRVAHVPLSRDLLRAVRRESDRLTASYRPAITLIELLAEAQGVTLRSAQGGPTLPGFLFDMNRFFQALLSRFLKDNLASCRVREEHRLKGMMSYVPSHNPRNKRAPQPRPDFVVAQNGRVAAVLDAKYRDLWVNPLPREMLYQLAIYALSGVGGGKAAILYPTQSQHAREARIQIADPVHGKRMGQVILRPVNLAKLDELISARQTAAVRRELAAFASQIAFGPSD